MSEKQIEEIKRLRKNEFGDDHQAYMTLTDDEGLTLVVYDILEILEIRGSARKVMK